MCFLMRSVQSNLFVTLGERRGMYAIVCQRLSLIKDAKELDALAYSDFISALVALRKRI
jgi:hypothetical protein